MYDAKTKLRSYAAQGDFEFRVQVGPDFGFGRLRRRHVRMQRRTAGQDLGRLQLGVDESFLEVLQGRLRFEQRCGSCHQP